MAMLTESDTTTAILEQLIGVGTAPKKASWEGYASVLTLMSKLMGVPVGGGQRWLVIIKWPFRH